MNDTYNLAAWGIDNSIQPGRYNRRRTMTREHPGAENPTFNNCHRGSGSRIPELFLLLTRVESTQTQTSPFKVPHGLSNTSKMSYLRTIMVINNIDTLRTMTMHYQWTLSCKTLRTGPPFGLPNRKHPCPPGLRTVLLSTSKFTPCTLRKRVHGASQDDSSVD